MKKLLLSALLALTAFTYQAQADITLVFTYDIDTDVTTASYSGSWDDFYASGQSLYTNASISPSHFYAFQNWFVQTNDSFSGATFAWGNATATSQEGDAFAFETGGIYAPPAYVEGDPINGSITFDGFSLEDLGLADGQSETYTSFNGGNVVNFSAIQVPETSSYALMFGLAGVSLLLRRR